MIWMGTSPNNPNVSELLNKHIIGLMCQPKSNLPKAGWIWAADNGCFSAKWDEEVWLRWLRKDLPKSGCLFATVPDVVGDAQRTLELFFTYAPMVRELAYPVAFVAQDRCQDADAGEIPWDEFDTLFLGGSTEWKMSKEAYELCVDARDRGKWVHIGRVNSYKRLAYWQSVAHSSDGTHLKFEPDVAAPRVAGWIRDLRRGTQTSILSDEV